MFLCTCSLAFLFLQSDAGCHQPLPQLSVSACALRVTPRRIESSHRLEASSKAGKRPWRISSIEKMQALTAVLSKIPHSNCCKIVPNWPLRPRRGRFGPILELLQCGNFGRTAVNAPLQWTAPVVPTQLLSRGSGQALSVCFSAFVVTKPRTDLIPASVGSLGLGLRCQSCRGKKNPAEWEKKPFGKEKDTRQPASRWNAGYPQT